MVMYLNSGSIEQSVYLNRGNYKLSFYHMGRTNYGGINHGNNPIDIFIDGTKLFTSSNYVTQFTLLTLNFNVNESKQQSLKLATTASGDQSIAIDVVKIEQA
mmetsp:Transcript_24955/g.23940  ORF Transcript_24955/g.23940 Transcript_24955/m.23940 type:complete len:102 (+) Transcript_24955:464-769(+)